MTLQWYNHAGLITPAPHEKGNKIQIDPRPGCRGKTFQTPSRCHGAQQTKRNPSIFTAQRITQRIELSTVGTSRQRAAGPPDGMLGREVRESAKESGGE